MKAWWLAARPRHQQQVCASPDSGLGCPPYAWLLLLIQLYFMQLHMCYMTCCALSHSWIHMQSASLQIHLHQCNAAICKTMHHMCCPSVQGYGSAKFQQLHDTSSTSVLHIHVGPFWCGSTVHVCTHKYTPVWIYKAVCPHGDTLQCGSTLQCIHT